MNAESGGVMILRIYLPQCVRETSTVAKAPPRETESQGFPVYM